jgi:hypothetical protein
VTVVCLLPVFLPIPGSIPFISGPSISKRFKISLADRKGPHWRDPAADSADDALHWGGTILFLIGCFDFVADILLVLSLARCSQWVLLACGITSIVLTTALTWYFAILWKQATTDYGSLNRGESAQWWAQNGRMLWPLLVILSSSRLDSLAIVRYRGCSGELNSRLNFEDSADRRYWHFIRNAGMYHYLVEDIPHVFISVALLLSGGERFTECHEDTFGLGNFAEPIAVANIGFSLFSMCFGGIQKLSHLRNSWVERRRANGSSGRLNNYSDDQLQRELEARQRARAQSGAVSNEPEPEPE